MILSLIVMWVLGLVSLAGYLWLLVLAFKKSIAWGLAVFFIPFVSLYFSIKFWAETKKPFLIHSGASVGLIVVGVISVFFAAAGGQPGKSNVQLSQPVMQQASKEPQSILSQEQQMALVIMEKTIEVMEKLPSSEKQQEILKVMRKFIRFQKTDFSAEEVHVYRAEVEAVLNRTDLNKNQRANIEKMLADVRKKEGPLVADLSPSIRPESETEVVMPGASHLTEATPASLRDLAIAKKRHAAAPASPEQRQRSDLNIERKEATSPRYQRTSFAQAKNHIGSSVRFTDLRGGEKDCILVKVAEKSLHCRKQFPSGSFSFSYREKEIKSLKVLR